MLVFSFRMIDSLWSKVIYTSDMYVCVKCQSVDLQHKKHSRNIQLEIFPFLFCCPKMAEKPSTSDQAQIVNIIAEEGDEYLVVRIEVTLCDCPNCLQEETTF